MPEAKGWEYNRYTLARPHSPELEERVKANIPAWLEFAKDENAIEIEAEAQRQAALENLRRLESGELAEKLDDLKETVDKLDMDELAGKLEGLGDLDVDAVNNAVGFFNGMSEGITI